MILSAAGSARRGAGGCRMRTPTVAHPKEKKAMSPKHILVTFVTVWIVLAVTFRVAAIRQVVIGS